MTLSLPPRYEMYGANPLLGEGGMGAVWRVRDVVLKTPVALKVVRADLAADVRFRKLFNLEIRMSARFTHPHIVPLHDVGELPDGTPYLGLALADAGSFANLRRQGIQWPELLRLTLQLLEALGNLHARGVLHRDLKPENILLHRDSDGRPAVWLADLGLANASSSLFQKKGRVEGTPGFMAPEQQLGLPREFGPPTDLFSLGVILWELVSGKMPFDPKTGAVDAKLDRLVPRSGLVVPRGLEAILTNLLSQDPLARFDLAADLRVELLSLGRAEIDRQAAGRGPVVRGAITPDSVPPPRTTAGRDVRVPWGQPTAERRLLPVPQWNRPKSLPLPAEAPLERGYGATASGSLALFALRRLPIVAREDARAVLWEHATAVMREGQARVVLVVGEAGCGKTRVVDSIGHTLEEGGWAEPIRIVYQQPAGKEDGYAGAARQLIRPWKEERESLEMRIVRRLSRDRGGIDEGIREEASVLVRWAGLGRDDDEPVPEGVGLREVYRTLESRSWRGLSCLFLENAEHAVDEGDGLSIAESVLRSVQDGDKKPLLCIVTMRAASLARDARLAQHVSDLMEAGAHRYDLPRLDRTGTEALIHESLTLQPSLVETLVDRCEGNPLFAHQLLRDWAERDWLIDRGNLVFGLVDGVDVDAAIPSDARALFRERVLALADASGQTDRFIEVTHMMALAGFSVPRNLLSEIAGQFLGDFVDGCGLWVQVDGDRCSFDHGLLYQVLREEAEERADVRVLHRRLGRLWSRQEGDEHLSFDLEVGRHAFLGEDWRLAIPALLRAAEVAWARGRTEELARVSEWAAVAFEREGSDRLGCGQAYLWNARALRLRGDVREAEGRFREALEAFRCEEDVPGEELALVGLGGSLKEAGRLDEAEELFKQCVQLAREHGHARAETEALEAYGWLEQQKRNYRGAALLFIRCTNGAAPLGDHRRVGSSLLGQAYVARCTGEFDDATELYREAADAFQEAGDPIGKVRAWSGLADVFRQRHALKDAEKLLRGAMGVAKEHGAVRMYTHAREGIGKILLARGELVAARRVLEGCARWAERQGLLELTVSTHLQLARVALAAGDDDQMYAHTDRVSQALADAPGHWLWASYRLLVAVMLARRGDESQAYTWLWSAADLGLGDVVDRDIVRCLEVIFDEAEARGWSNIVRVGGKLLGEELTALGDEQAANEVADRVRAMVTGTEG